MSPASSTPSRGAGTPAGNPLQTADENRRMFDRISPRYDRMNAILSLGLDRRWRRLAVAALGPADGKRYLDVGCGTGDLCVAILRTAPAAFVTGMDLSAKMLALAADKTRQAGAADRVQLCEGDVTSLAFGDAAYDGIISAFCIRNVADRPRGFREMRRVLRPGGRAVILELTRPRSALVRFGHKVYGRAVVPLVAALLSDAGAYRYLTQSIDLFPDSGRLAELMGEAGFKDVTHRPLSGGIVTLFTGQC